ncbi:MAG: NADH-quinone oxidoreductase subunit M, partial [Deltaproteobacteria bacterium]|nr:NADH-quinone oxidoreductase subunit M [Deltaproteobacteria bacterium]
FHTWLPDAHVEAPTAGSIVLAGVLLKMGTYGFLRFSLPMLPDASRYCADPILWLSIVAIIYGGYLALAQDNIKKLVAYSSVSRMGFITLGLFVFNVQGVEGGILQMLNHGITTSALFLCVGVIYERTHTRDLNLYGGLAKAVPIYTTFLAIYTLSSMAIPGTNSFIGELLILVGSFAYNPLMGGFAVIGAAIGAAYLLGMYKRVALGEITHSHIKEAWDVNIREIAAMTALVVFVVWIGFYPKPFLNIMHVSVEHLLGQIQVVQAP